MTPANMLAAPSPVAIGGDLSLRKALSKFYRKINDVTLLDYKVKVVSSKQGTESVVRVLIESGAQSNTVGGSPVEANVIAFNAGAGAANRRLGRVASTH